MLVLLRRIVLLARWRAIAKEATSEEEEQLRSASYLLKYVGARARRRPGRAGSRWAVRRCVNHAVTLVLFPGTPLARPCIPSAHAVTSRPLRSLAAGRAGALLVRVERGEHAARRARERARGCSHRCARSLAVRRPLT